MQLRNRLYVSLNTKGLEYKLILLCIFLPLLLINPMMVRAQNKDTGSIELKCILPEAKFRLYQVGTLSEDDGSIILDDALSKYEDKIDFESYTAAINLSRYVKLENMQSLAIETTDENGELTFANLEEGMYLICGSQTMYKGSLYLSSPVLVQLPMIQDGILTMNPIVIHKNDSPKRLTDQSAENKNNTNSTNYRIPQTGQLWWPVFALSCLGITLLITGYRFNKKR